MKYQFIKDHSGEFPVKKMAEVLNVSKSRYYSWLKNPFVKERKNHNLECDIERIFEAKRRLYGSPRIHSELKDKGIICGHNRVEKIMRKKGLKARKKRRFIKTTDSNHDYPIAPNIVNREFTVFSPDQTYVSDITYVWTLEGWLYLCTVIDLFSRRVVGYSMSDKIDTVLVSDALKMALLTRKPEKGLIFHSDRGSQYASYEFRDLLKSHEIIQSMSRKGNCWDNACAESFFSTLKIEEVYCNTYRTRHEARISIFEYITVFYNRYRKHSFLDYMSPENYELNWFRNIA
jgi:transposase InsO family protein